MVPVFFGATFLLFAALYLLPGDPTQILGGERGTDPLIREILRQRWHLDEPIYVQYFIYMKNIFTGDFGTSFRLGRSVASVITQALPWSIKLALSAIVLEIVFGIIVGVVAAVRRYSLIDTLSTVSTSVLVAVPVFWLGLMLQIVFGLRLQGTPFELPISGVQEGFRSYILPSITLASVFIAVTARLTRTTMLEVMRQDYVRTAMAKGLSERSVVFKHGLRNGLIPVVTNIGLDFGALIGGAVLTETVFAWPGIGRQVFIASTNHDNPVIIGTTIIFLVAFLLVNLAVDISYAFLDPRIRYD
jgi:oligopeptide transport system permease protein